MYWWSLLEAHSNFEPLPWHTIPTPTKELKITHLVTCPKRKLKGLLGLLRKARSNLRDIQIEDQKISQGHFYSTLLWMWRMHHSNSIFFLFFILPMIFFRNSFASKESFSSIIVCIAIFRSDFNLLMFSNNLFFEKYEIF